MRLAAQLRDVGHLELLLPAATATNRGYFETSGWLSTPVYELKALPVGVRVAGPALLIDNTQTIVVVPGAVANILESCVVTKLGRAAQISFPSPATPPHRAVGAPP
jgi:5-oxoprolinase (ATP-hydrolysing)